MSWCPEARLGIVDPPLRSAVAGLSGEPVWLSDRAILQPTRVMPGLVPGIHAETSCLFRSRNVSAWMAGTSPAMTRKWPNGSQKRPSFCWIRFPRTAERADPQGRICPVARRSRRLAGSGGFTLVETLVAFTILAVLLNVMFRGVVEMRAGAKAFDARTEAALVARSILDETLANRDLKNGTTSGERSGHRWTIIAKAVDLASQLPHAEQPDAAPGPKPDAPAKPSWTPQRIIVRVETGGKPIEVQTIRLARAS